MKDLSTFELESQRIYIKENPSDKFYEHENVIEFQKNNKIAVCTLSQGRLVSRVKELAKHYPGQVQIVAENTDSTIVATFPAGWIRIKPPKSMSWSPEKRAAARKNLEGSSNPSQNPHNNTAY